ncbi:MAG: AAA family ATPase, partial [Bdellovibrionales bacterium]|nr:AAA family ATPase [Bdellovibrionales bacterium]
MRGAFNFFSSLVFAILMSFSVTTKASNEPPQDFQDLAVELASHLNTMNLIRGGSYEQDIERIKEVVKSPSTLVVDAILIRAAMEVIDVDPSEVNVEFVVFCIKQASSIASPDLVNRFGGLYQTFQEHISTLPKFSQIVEPALHKAVKNLSKNGPLPMYPKSGTQFSFGGNFGANSPENEVKPPPVPTSNSTALVKYISPEPLPQEIFEKRLQKIEQMKAFLEDRVVGQPEVLEAALDAEFKIAVLGNSGKSGIYMKLLGLPGVGKDTFAMAWADAIHNREGAWTEHLMTVHPIQDRHDLSNYKGSSKGVVGSEDIPPFIAFLVKHSAGKYMIVESEDKRSAKQPYYIALNPEWEPGMVLPGYFTPEEGIVFLNETHNWSKYGRDAFKTFVEEGRFPIGSPGSADGEYEGVTEIIVPVRRVEASNEAIGLISNLRLDGTRIGSPMTYDEMFNKWKLNHQNYELIRQTILSEGSQTSGVGQSKESSSGTSIETLNRVPDRLLILMRPLSPEDLKKVLKFKLRSLEKLLASSQAGFNELTFTYTDRVIDFLQEWNYIADSGGRAMQDRVESMIELSIFDAIKAGKIKSGEKGEYELDVVRNEDGTYSVNFNGRSGESFSIYLRQTESAKYPEQQTPESIKDLYTLGARLSQHVFGLDEEAEEIGNRLAVQLKNRKRNVTAETAEYPAISFMFLGLSSTGKTEMSKAIAREVYNDESRMLTIPFGDIKTEEQYQQFISGSKQGNAFHKSKLMEMWDNWNGEFVLNLDELSNAPASVQERLYDLLREKLFSGFADGKARPTQNLIITITGNAGEEWYHQIPREGVPIVEQQAALYEIHRQAMQDPSARRALLERHFKKALINRVGEQNILFFPPLAYGAIRQLTQLRLGKAIEELKATREKIGWNLQFLDSDEYIATVKVLETEGFELFEQGSSLVRFVEKWKSEIDTVLSKNGVA